MATHKRVYTARKLISPFLFALLFCSLSSGLVRAEVTLDGTLGPSGKISGPNYRITADLGRQVGANLFHSFGKFNVNTGESAIFSGPESISNIISRVTGGTPSWIDGYLRSEISGANLYLLNPSGVMFGPNASLDVSGSFHVSTADYLKLGQDGRYYATTPENSVLTSAPPSAFGFLGSNPKSISFEETFLKVPSGKTISVIGGDIQMHNSMLYAPRGGRIDLASAASAGEVFPGETDLSMEGFTKQGNITVSRDTEFTTYSDIDVSGALLSDEDGGAVYIRSGRFELQGGKINASTAGINPGGGVDIRVTDDVEVRSNGIMNGGSIESASLWTGQAGDISISSKKLIMDDGAYMSTGTIGFGDAGNVNFDVGSLTMTGGSQVSTNALNVFGTGYEMGHGGDIVVNASESILISGYDNNGNQTGFYANTSTQGDAGNMAFVTPSLFMDQLGVLSAKTGSTANGGAISLQVENLSIKGGASIGTETLLGGGRGGDITINASQSVVVSGKSLDPFGLLSPSGLFASTGFGEGMGGDINVTTPYFLLDQGGQVHSISEYGGDAGRIRINVNNLSLTGGGGLSVSTSGSGQGGDIAVTATDSVAISGENSGIDAISFGSGNAGNITLNCPALSIHDKGSILALTTESGQGGQINVSAIDNITINNADISTTSIGSGNGGTIFLNTGNLQMDNDAAISSKGKNTGRGGDITIQTADSIRLLNDSSITTETLQSDGGNIEIKAPELVYLLNSDITTSVQGGLGNGGNITIDPRFAILNNSSVIANAYGGNGGNIDIVSDYFLASTDSIVQASSQLGISGTINITAPDIDLSGSLTVLPSKYLDATSLLRDRCEAMSDENASSLVIGGRGGRPIEPDDYLPSP